MSLLAREHPEVRAVDTFDADDNRWMLTVDEAMGDRPQYRMTEWELDLTPPDVAGGQAGITAPISAAASGP